MQTSQSNQSQGLNQFPFKRQISIAKSGNVYWESDTKKRCIGKIVGNSFICDRDPARHLFQKAQAYGFNWELVKYGSFVFVIVHLPNGEQLGTTREYILRNGFFLKFSKLGYEKQVFLKVEDFGKPLVEPTSSQLVLV